jgi:streptogramin lyase
LGRGRLRSQLSDQVFQRRRVPLSPPSGYTGGGLFAPYELAVDASGNVWVTNIDSDLLSKFSSGGIALSPSTGYTGGTPYFAVDGADNIWCVPITGAAVIELANDGTPISPSTGYTGPGLGSTGIAIDGSGNVWVANQSSSILAEIVGAAAPLVTPLATAVTNDKLGQRP